MVAKEEIKLKTQQEFKHATVSVVDGKQHIAVVASKTDYIPINEFKNIFEFIGQLVKDKNITKLIFDKRSLSVFHQPSMEWYFTEWKEKMFGLGLKTHRKILPNNEVFRQSVKIGREKISKMFPDGKFNQMDIRYADSLEEAIEK